MGAVSFPGVQRPSSAIGLGCMRIRELDDDAMRGWYAAARDVGIDFFDHAAVYGSRPHECETRFGDALHLTASQREEITLQTKCGTVAEGPYLDFSYDHIVSSVEGSLRALRTDYLDILLLHRPDALVEPDEVARAFDDLAAAGKVLAFGVSNHTPRQMDLLATAVDQPIVANQLQLSLGHAPAVAQGFAMNIEGSEQALVADGGGVLDYCRTKGIAVQAWAPFQAGRSRGVFLGSSDFPVLNAAIDELAHIHEVPPAAIAAAWILRHPAAAQVLLGSTNPARIAEAARCAEVTLARPEWYGLLHAAGYRARPGPPPSSARSR
ncbi:MULTISPECIES: aldo/keto reductase [unclassified Nocardioides]|uniref:aldo/keto reductase n=1 Tax=unclassified Nocardioides TaxID=2615069 RepID=UPI000A65EE7D|nr:MULTISPECIES: aldo/keto reductase [unclassified Nocardioides]